MDASQKATKKHPQQSAYFPSKFFFCWLGRLMWKGYKKGLQEEDLYETLDSDLSNKLGDALEQQWDLQLKRSKEKGKDPSLTTAIFKTFAGRYLLCGLLCVLDNLILRIACPLLLGITIQYFMPGTGIRKPDVFYYAGGLVLAVFLKSCCYHHYTMQTQLIGMRVRIACCSLLYRKVLRLSKQTMDMTATGKIVNLMSNDVSRFDVAAPFLHWLWLSFVQVAIVTYFIFLYVDIAAIIGFIFIFLSTVPVQGTMARLSSSLRKKVANLTDERMRLMNEIVTGVQVIKMYGWELPFAKLVDIARKNEIKQITLASYLKGFLLSAIVFTERSSLFVTLLAYSLFGNVVTPDKVFAMAQFYNILNVALALSFPMGVTNAAECSVSVSRIKEFLMIEEKDAQISKSTKLGEINFKSVTARWCISDKENTLKNINFVVESGKLCSIIGPVGSGKTTILLSLLGELKYDTGSISLGGKVSYASQEPWIFVGSVKQNILFGQEYNPIRYREVVRVCSLLRDFKLLPFGDATLVGEKGITLSGGQRARINLARSVYREADIYVLDDPLSAVDTHVGRYLFDECINGFLSNKTRILVTHQLQYLQHTDKIIIMNQGAIEAHGSFADIVASGLNFAKLLTHENNNLEENQLTKLGQENKAVRRSRRIGSRRNTGVISTQGLPDSSEPSTISVIMEENGQLHQDPSAVKENQGHNKFSFIIYWKYLRAGGSVCVLTSVLAIIIIGQIVTSGCDYWVTFWTNSAVEKAYKSKTSTSLSNETMLGIYGALIVILIILMLARSATYFKLSMRASQKLHNAMFETVLRSTMAFFDTNPSGRILNRFSKDVGAMDELLPQAILMATQIFLVLSGILVMVLLVNYFMIVPMIIVGGIFYWVSLIFMTTARNVKWIEGAKRSPVFSHLSDTLNGLSTVRAAGVQTLIKNEFDQHQDHHTTAWSLYVTTTSALGMWLDILSSIFVALVTFSFLILDSDSFAGGNVGLAISQSLILTGMLQYGIQQLSEMCSQMISVERVIEYTDLQQEAALQTSEDRKPPPEWPLEGSIRFENVNLRYNKKLPPVLKSLAFNIHPKEKVGVVGRTGAGKSSLLAAIFRLAPLEGNIVIDNIDCSTLGLHDLRRKISIIPQEPVLFSASLRYNLDPFGEFDDVKLWSALEEVEMKSAVESLDIAVTEGGSNFSVGQRQLICLARAILRENKILVIDEATANVDPKTDMLIQHTIRQKFGHCTVLTIAHRLNTIMDADRILVMDAGCAVEFDKPHTLLQNTTGFLTRLVEETGPAMALTLRKIAEETYNK